MSSSELNEAYYEIVLQLAEGYTNVEIARNLGLTSNALNARVQTMLALLGARNRTHVVALAYHRGILKVPEREEERT